jgi:hypothetical protein
MSGPAHRLALAIVAGTFAFGVLACGGGLSDAKSDFRKGRVAEAKAQLVALEPESRGWAPRRRAEYSLYRGLVHHSLGDRAAAGVWLAEAKTIEDTHPRSLAEEDRVRLQLALESLAADTSSSPR